ncbi:MAG: ribosomal-processing cysteine protease Prp [Holdemanella sp.]|nr:ribosomal-processing cysteine protease Prp [Holdemanella sp.]
MVTVKVLTNNKSIQSIQVRGHAEYADPGQDLVCAGASSIGIGALNGLDELFNEDVHLEIKDNSILIQVLNPKDELQTVLKFLMEQYKTMAEVYPNNIQIVWKEV